jgi:hypothetical protein
MSKLSLTKEGTTVVCVNAQVVESNKVKNNNFFIFI